jgi:hypothetical protein
VTGEVVTAAVMNTHIRDNLNALAVSLPPGAKTVGTSGGFGETWHPNLVAVGTSTSTQSVALTSSQIYASPLMIPRGTLDRMSFSVTISATATARQGIYEAVSATDPYPGALIVDSGDVNLSSTGLKTTTINVVIEPTKMYWIVLQTGATGASITGWIGPGFISPFGTLAVAAWDTFNFQSHVAFRMARSYAALPSTFPALSSPTWENPLMHGVRYSA